MPSTKYELPDQGDTLVRLANEAAGDRGAQLVAAEVNRVRRPDRALVASELSSVKMDKHSPLALVGHAARPGGDGCRGVDGVRLWHVPEAVYGPPG